MVAPGSPAAAEQADARDQKGNSYMKRKLLRREFLGQSQELMRLTFELPAGVSLGSLGVDIGLGDFVRMRPFAEEHQAHVENPAGGRAYSPVLAPDTPGSFGILVKSYGPADKIVGVSSLLKHAPLGTDFLVTNHVEHVFWEQRQRGYYCNERNIESGSDGAYHIGLIAFGIGITEIAPVAMSELLDPRVKRVTILWANKHWSDAEWVWDRSGEEDDLVRQFFASQGKYGDRLQIKHILSREERPEASFHGRITADVLRETFLTGALPARDTRFLTVGTTEMIDFAYTLLAGLGLDAAKELNWGGSNLLYRKLGGGVAGADRRPSPLLAEAAKGKRPPSANDEDPSGKRLKSSI